MRKLLFFALFASVAYAQRIPQINLYTGDPTGVACTHTYALVQSRSTGAIYVCLAGVYSSVANASGYPGVTPDGSNGLTVTGGQSLGGNQTVTGTQTVTGNQTVGGNSTTTGTVQGASVLAKGTPDLSPDIFASSSDGHSGLDYCYAINQAYAFIKAAAPNTQATIKLSNGKHKCWSTVAIDGSILLNGNGAQLNPQSGGASSVWGSASATITGCTMYPMSPVITCSSNSTASLHQYVIRTVGAAEGAYVTCKGLWTGGACVTDSTHITLSLPSRLEIVGFSHTSTTFDGVNLLNSIATGQIVTGSDIPSGTTISAIHNGGSGQYDTQSLTLSAAATSSVDSDILQVASPWTSDVTFQSMAPVIQYSYGTNCIFATEGPCVYSGIQNLTIFDSTYGGVSGVIGFQLSGNDHLFMHTLEVKGVSGPAFIMGGQIPAASATAAPGSGKLRESDAVNMAFMYSGQPGAPAVQLMTGVPDCDPSRAGSNVCANPDEINQIGVTQIHADLNNGANLEIGTYNPVHYLASPLTVPAASPACSVTSNVVTLNVVNSLASGNRVYISGFSSNCAFLNGNTYTLNGSTSGSALVFPLYTGFTHADTTDATQGYANKVVINSNYGPRLIWFQGDCQFEMLQEGGPGTPSRKEAPTDSNVIIRGSSSTIGFSGCELNNAGYGHFVLHSFADNGVQLTNNTRFLSQTVGLAYTVDTTHARDATPYISYTSDPQSNTGFPTNGSWNGLGLVLKGSGACATGCNVYLASPGVSSDGQKAFLSAALWSSATLGSGKTLTSGQPPFFAAFEATSGIVPLFFGAVPNSPQDTTYQLYTGSTTGAGYKLWAGTYPSFNNYQGAVNIETLGSSFPFAGFVASQMPTGQNMNWRLCLDHIWGECGYLRFDNVAGAADPSQLNTVSLGFTNGSGTIPLTAKKSGDVSIGHNLAVVNDATIGHDATVTNNVTANNVVNAVAGYQVNGVAKGFSPLRAGAWTISSSTTVAVTFATSIVSTPSSCQLTTNSSTATTGVPFATALATTGFTVNVPTSGSISGTYSCVLNNAN